MIVDDAVGMMINFSDFFKKKKKVKLVEKKIPGPIQNENEEE